jgi:starch synthase
MYLKTVYKNDPFFKDTKTVLTVHNLAYQGIFPADQMAKTGLPNYLLSVDGLEFFGKISLLKGGLIYATVLNTVSRTYAEEIQTKEYGCGLDGILRRRRLDLYGVINGIDYRHWDPQADEKIFKKYSSSKLKDKYFNKQKLQEEVKLDAGFKGPFIGIISRLADQKGLDLIAAVIDDILEMDLQFILLGTGDEAYHELFDKIAGKYPEKTSINLRFDAVLAQRIYAGCDMFLMPSRYEPCGLGQIISFKYGTIPIVRKTGGLADTVIDFDSDKEKGNGFVFEEYDPGVFLKAVKRAVSAYQDKKEWEKLAQKVMKLDFSWDQSAKEYIKIYKLALEKE